jgi:hypothetical protein
MKLIVYVWSFSDMRLGVVTVIFEFFNNRERLHVRFKYINNELIKSYICILYLEWLYYKKIIINRYIQTNKFIIFILLSCKY